MESKDLHLRLLYPAKLSFKIEGKIRSFPGNKKLKVFFNTKAVLQQMLKGLFKKRKKKKRKNKKKKPEENSLTIKWHYMHIYQ